MLAPSLAQPGDTVLKLRDKLRKPRELLVLTHRQDGPQYGLLSGARVSEQDAKAVQSDLFVKPNDDGLLPGHSQTWRADE